MHAAIVPPLAKDHFAVWTSYVQVSGHTKACQLLGHLYLAAQTRNQAVAIATIVPLPEPTPVMYVPVPASCLDFIFSTEHVVYLREIIGTWHKRVELPGRREVFLKVSFLAEKTHLCTC